MMDVWTNDRFCVECEVYMNDKEWCNECNIPNHHEICCEQGFSLKNKILIGTSIFLFIVFIEMLDRILFKFW